MGEIAYGWVAVLRDERGLKGVCRTKVWGGVGLVRLTESLEGDSKGTLKSEGLVCAKRGARVT